MFSHILIWRPLYISKTLDFFKIKVFWVNATFGQKSGVCSSVRLDTNIFIWTCVLNCQTLKTLFSPNSNNPNDFFKKKLGSIHFFLLHLWAKYELIWSNITAQTLSLGANLLVKAQNIPQNSKCSLFFWPKVAFTQDTLILKRTKGFEMRSVCHIYIC